ncbi:nuclear transport factor 2 family protein [Pseudonocardia kujensis]|uniref:nuclear transport factor 2 family protein n=1 Tax=Pseudonocardia kujensis TaxID=1128675 RepID=UPI001E3599C1|nr:nuclear transport factor 2 family protein [Pseudonocardia kujensis]MCE0762002.1 nuclear transport factor 2 family protein [Pseudonocardia kujensis]
MTEATNEGLRPRPARARETTWLAAASAAPIADDRAAVVERVHRYGWAFDERRADLLAECFTAGGVWEGSVMGTELIGPFRGRQAVTDWLGRFWPTQPDQRRYVLTNALVEELVDDRATVLAYLVLTSASAGVVRMETTGCYRFSLAREADGCWRIAVLRAGFDAPF